MTEDRGQRTDKRNRLLAALFAQAKKKGIASDELREAIAPGIIGKRLSKATMQEIVRVIEHLSGKTQKTEDRGQRTEYKYKSSLPGLKEEIADIAKKRFGEDWEGHLNNLCKKFNMLRWQWLDVRHGKAVKETLLRLQSEGDYEKSS